MNTIARMASVHLKNTLLALLLLIVGTQAHAESRGVYYHNDLFGSPVAMTDQAGNVIARKDYTPYGEASGNDGANHVGFTGHAEDQLTHLNYMQQRLQDPKTARFLSMDSKPVDPNDPATFNRYVYANNNPYRYTDPDGDSPIEWGFIAADVASAGANVASGNYAGAAWDAANVALDVAGPPGASEASHAVKAVKAAKNVEKAAHGNKVDGRAATLYEKYDKDGNFLKHGVTKHENPAKRYTSKEIGGGEVRRTDQGPRSEMIKKERGLVEQNPGPDNRERWAGKGKQLEKK